MSEATRQLKIKTGVVKRFTKELQYYGKERDREQQHVDKMKASGADEHDIKQAEHVLQESAMMIPETRKNLEAALRDLQAYMDEEHEGVAGTEALTAAREVIDAADTQLQQS